MTESDTQPAVSPAQRTWLKPWFVWVGIAIWVAVIVCHSGMAAFSAFFNSGIFLVVVTVLGSATRTLPLRLLVLMYLLGGLTATFSLYCEHFLFLLGLDISNPLRPVFVATIEEAWMLLPLLWVLARMKGGTYFTGATDVVLLSAFCGAGFAVAEAAALLARHDFKSVAGLPVVLISANLGFHVMNLQAVWCSLAGISIGIALLFFRHKPQFWPVAVSGAALAILDHMILNWTATAGRGGFAEFVSKLIFDGQLTLVVFVIGAAAVVLADLWVIRKHTPERVKKLANLGKVLSWDRWSTLLELRSIAYAGMHYRETSSPEVKTIISGLTTLVLNSTCNRYKKLHPELQVVGAAAAE